MHIKVYLLVFLAVAAAAAVLAGWKLWIATSPDSKTAEKFADGDGRKEARGSRGYRMRLFTLSVFESTLHRKPTQRELSKYGALGSRRAIVNAVERD